MSTRRPAHAFATIAVALVAGLGCVPERPAAPGADRTAHKKLRIAGIGFQDDQFFRQVELGMRAEAGKLGVELLPGTSAGTLDKEVSLIDTHVAAKVDAICVAPLNPKSSIPALQRAVDAGIKVLTFDAYVQSDLAASSIRSDQSALGALTGAEARQYIEAKLAGKAKVAIISYVTLLSEPATQRTDGFVNQIRALPGVQIVARQDAWLAPKAADVVAGILTANPDLDMVWAANEGGTVGAVTAVRAAGKAGKVVVFGTDISTQMADFLLDDDNVLQAVTGQKPYDIGAMAISSAVKAVRGEPVDKQVSLPGTLFTREKPDEVRKHREYLTGLAK
jgi:ABC-type sugar transport system substrate-binding protein